MGILINTGFDVGSSNPIDSRTVKNTTDERDALISDGLVYENLKVYCKDTQTEYRWTGTEWEEVGSGGTVDLSGYAKTYTSLAELELTADATIDDVISTLKDGETAIITTNEFTDYLTMFPNYCNNDQYAILKVEKKNSNRCFIEWRQKDGNAYAIGGLNSNNVFTNWNNLVRFKKDGFADDSIVCIGNAVSDDGTVQTLESLGFSADILLWENGVYRVSHFGGLVNLPSDLDANSNPAFRLEHHNLVKNNVNPNSSIHAPRHSIIYCDNGDIYCRFYKSGATAGVYIKDTGWRKIQTSGDKATLVADTTTLKLDVTKKNSAWNGAIKLTYVYGASLSEIEVSFTSNEVRWAVISGQKYVKNITFTQDSSNTAHYTIGIQFAGKVYGCYQADVIGVFADINSLTSEAFTGVKTAVYYSPWGKNNGVSLVGAPEDIGLTFPCTSVQLAQAMIDKFNKTVKTGVIGLFNCEIRTKTITDAPSDYGLLHIETFIPDRMIIRFDGISGANYAGSWIGQIKSSNGAFSGITWCRIDNDTRVTTLETQVSELFQSVSNGKSLVANAITGKGVSTSTTSTFATMATNISKLDTGTYKTESISATNSSDSNKTLTFTFSNTVLGITKIKGAFEQTIHPNGSGYTFVSISDNIVTVHIKGSGTVTVTARIVA